MVAAPLLSAHTGWSVGPSVVGPSSSHLLTVFCQLGTIHAAHSGKQLWIFHMRKMYAADRKRDPGDLQTETLMACITVLLSRTHLFQQASGHM